MAVLTDLLESENLKPAVDRTYPPKSIPEALAYLVSGRTRGRSSSLSCSSGVGGVQLTERLPAIFEPAGIGSTTQF